MNKEEIESLFKKYKVRIPKEKQGQSECYECKIHHKYSLTWTSFLYEYEEKYYCFEHIVIILLQQENQELKKQLEEAQENIILLKASKPMLEYKKALEENQQKEFIEYMNKTIEELECDDVDDEEMKGYLIQRIDTFKEILSKYKKIKGNDK